MSEPTTEFVNPVPDARWDGRNRRRLRALAAILGAISLAAALRIAWTVFEVAHGVTLATDLVGLTHGDRTRSATSEHVVADGASDLPGGYARLSYTPLPNQYEYSERADDYGAYGSSRWGLATAQSGRMNQVDLSHWLLAPGYDTVAEENKHLRAAHPGKSITGPRPIKIDGHNGATWKATEPNGDVKYTTWFFGYVHSFRLECGYMVGSDDYAKQCKQILRSLRFER